MASVQVLKKQEHLAAGKKKLEEFRRKKAAEKAKKATSASQLHASNGALHEKEPSEIDNVRLTDSNGAGTSDALAEGHSESLGVVANTVSSQPDIAQKSDFASSNDTYAKPSILANTKDSDASALDYLHLNDGKYKGGTVGLDGYVNANDRSWHTKDDDRSSSLVASVIENDQLVAPQLSSTLEVDHSQSSYHGSDDHPSNNIDVPEKYLSLGYSGASAVFHSDIVPNNSINARLQDKLTNVAHDDDYLTSSLYQESVRPTTSVTGSAFGGGQKFSGLPDMVEKKLSSSVVNTGNVNHSSPWTSDHRHADYNFETQSSSNFALTSPPATGRRSRPSFLDSIQISKGPSGSPLHSGEVKADSYSSKVHPMDGLGSSASQRSVNSSVASGDGIDLFNHVKENKYEFSSQKQNEDFAALEQHIEDLTQEKFSLQRALEASRALAENLASENSALTDNFNQQGSVVTQLKFEMEKLQEEIKAQLVELETVRIEYANAQLECNAADQRAKLLASELIELEEKSLRVRSNELKLERQLESSQAEISSYRKKLSSLEKDRQDLQSTVDALLEEKKLLQSKLQKASASGKSINSNKISYSKKDVSTSTEDLGASATTESSNSENFGASSLGDDVSSSQFPHENILLSLEGLPLTIPSDQLRMIQNINTLMAELALEKDQMMQALSAESSKLMELNKELTRKLEAQTQRLELLTAQSMATDNIQLRQPEPRSMPENTTYADEGDEVVERVLGWIMKLFPGGPSRRRTGKHH